MYTRTRSVEDALNMAKGWLIQGYKIEIVPLEDGWYEVRRR